MRELTYAAMLLFVLVATLPLEIVLRTRVYARLRRAALVVLCVAPLFVVADVLSVRLGHWSFGLDKTLGIVLPGGLPIEEVLFFVVVPLASVMTIEAVRRVRGWTVGDEEPAEPQPPPAADPVGVPATDGRMNGGGA